MFSEHLTRVQFTPCVQVVVWFVFKEVAKQEEQTKS